MIKKLIKTYQFKIRKEIEKKYVININIFQMSMNHFSSCISE